MKVVHLCHEFSALTETFIYDYLTELNRQGLEGHVVTYQVSNLDSRPFPNVHHVPRPGRWDAWRLAYRVLAKAGIGSRPDTSWDASWAAYRHRVAPLIRRQDHISVQLAGDGPAEHLLTGEQVVAARLARPEPGQPLRQPAGEFLTQRLPVFLAHTSSCVPGKR